VGDTEPLDLLDHGGLEVVADRASGRGERDDHVHGLVVGLLDRAHHSERDDVLAELRVDHASEGVLDLFASRHLGSV
jgi:hypothetical protein